MGRLDDNPHQPLQFLTAEEANDDVPDQNTIPPFNNKETWEYPPAITSASQQARPSIAPRVMPPPPAVVPATRKAEIPSAVPTQAPSTRTTGPNRYSGGCMRNWEKQLGYATRKGQEAREEFLNRYGSWYPNSREDDDEFLQQYRRDNEGVYIRCA